MAPIKLKAVFSAEPDQLREIREHVKSGRYGSASEFLREAIREKIARLRREELARQVARYCEEKEEPGATGFVASQAFDQEGE
jgi:Arc/MetJ-type ribon-helix-helix transcriptional regulator